MYYRAACFVQNFLTRKSYAELHADCYLIHFVAWCGWGPHARSTLHEINSCTINSLLINCSRDQLHYVNSYNINSSRDQFFSKG